METISRREFIKIGVIVGSSTILGFTINACAKKNLFIYNWPYYISERTIPEFERRFKVKVTYDNYSSNEEMLAKIQAGGSVYDLIFPSDYTVSIMIEQNLLEKLDMDKLPNFKNIDDRFKNLPFDPGNKYSIPYFWGTTGIGYNADKVTEVVDSWSILWNEKYKGRISMLDDMRTMFNPALKLMGYSINTTDPKQLEKAKELMVKQKPLVKAYTSDTYVELLASGDLWLAQAYSGDVFQAMKDNKSLRYVIPKEGTDMYVDNMCIPKGAKNKSMAEKFINYIMEPEVSADLTNSLWYATPNKEAKKYIKPEILNNKSIYPPDEVLQKCELQKDLKDANKLYEKIYNEIKSL